MNKQATLLIVDDNPTNIKVLYDFLRDYGFRVLVAKNGEDALNKLTGIIPDLILLDVMMPGIDGFETCRQIKNSPSLANVPIIFMTALSDTGNKVKGLNLGAADYITKPFQQEEVLARINLHIKLRYLTQELEKKNTELENLNTFLEQKVTERTFQLKQAQAQLVLSEKMSSLGELVAGIAHEVNNPVNFIHGNLTHAQNYANELIHLIKLYQINYPNPVPEIAETLALAELDYLITDFPQLLNSMKEGTQRIIEISHSMRTFSRADQHNKVKYNIHQGLDGTLLIIKHRLTETDEKPKIEVIKKYGELPEIECYPGQLNQVFMNLIANAIDALQEVDPNQPLNAHLSSPREITIQTQFLSETQEAKIQIQDNGIGIPGDIKSKIFEPLFTTKPVGKGTGLGLAIVRQIIEEKHRGKINCISNQGQGTVFEIYLPV